MDITARGDDNVWRASEVDQGSQCMRKVGYARLGAVDENGDKLVGESVQQEMSWALVGGLAVDSVLTLSAQGGGAPVPKDAFHEFWNNHVAAIRANGSTIEQNPEDERSIYQDGQAVLELYFREHAPRIKPVGTQVLASVEIGDVKLVGHIDLIRETELPDGRKTRIISDWKFTKKTPSQMPARTYSRGWAYDLMLGDEHHQIELIYLRRGLKTPKVGTDSHVVTEAQRTQVRMQVEILAELYRARYFPFTDPTSWACSADWCNWWRACRGRAGGPALIPGERKL